MAGSSRRRQQEEKQRRIKGKEKVGVQGTSHVQQPEMEKVTGRGVGRAPPPLPEKEKEKEKFGQQFYSMFSPQQHGQILRIPPLFHPYLGNEPTGVVSLKARSGNTWAVELASDTQGLFFGNGWKEFVEDHSLEIGHALTFRYEGRSKFSVVVFDGTCSEKTSAFLAKPRKDAVIRRENDEGDLQVNAADCGEDVVVEQEIKDEEDMDTTEPPAMSAVPLEENDEVDFFF